MQNFDFKDETYKIIGAAMEVHKVLGHGFLEGIYHDALMVELKKRNIPFKSEAPLPVRYKGVLLSRSYIADIICYDKIIVELKALSGLTSDHDSQVLNYLKASGNEIGLLLNFGTSSLEYKRLIWSLNT
ncbi:hypothetical protein SDC9_48399 [bioreactor metagenome]|uniref:GxxExxY protein n=1 Tax=bioreactor metagenome TaxID=1076179 RepID=A0A644WIQ6_9ZZZZ